MIESRFTPQAAVFKGVFTLLLGIDIGATKVALALGDRDGGIHARRRRPTAPSGSPERDIEALVTDARALLAEAGVAATALECVGVCAPGPIDPAGGRVLGPPNLPGWDDVPIVAELSRALGCAVHLENDANAAALAEWRHGAGRGHHVLDQAVRRKTWIGWRCSSKRLR